MEDSPQAEEDAPIELTDLLPPENSAQDARQALAAMLAAIDNAKDHVFLCTYIFNAGQVATAFGEALARAAERGVDARLLVDGIGMRSTVSASSSLPWRTIL